MSAVAERVALGAAFLGEHDPEWWREDVERAIDLVKLDIEDPGTCVLGQRCPLESRSVHGSPYVGMAVRLGGPSLSADLRCLWEWAVGFGFAIGDGDDPRELTDEWVRVITGRRAAS